MMWLPSCGFLNHTVMLDNDLPGSHSDYLMEN